MANINRRLLLTPVGLAAAAALALVGGSAAAGALTLLPAGVTTDEGVAVAPMPAPEYKINDSGQSYGSAASARTPAEEPVLIAVEATSGRQGYVYKTDLDEATGASAAGRFRSPEEALAWQESAGQNDRTISVFLSDGKTLVGDFLIQGIRSQERIASR